MKIFKSIFAGACGLAFVAFMFFGSEIARDNLKGKLAPIFKEFTQVTTKRYPDEKSRTNEMERLLALAERTASEMPIHKCSVMIMAFNPRTIYRHDKLFADCSLIEKPKDGMPVIFEYKHNQQQHTASN